MGVAAEDVLAAWREGRGVGKGVRCAARNTWAKPVPAKAGIVRAPRPRPAIGAAILPTYGSAGEQVIASA
jgi:hypothetical protein